MKNWNWLRLATLASGVGCIALSIVIPTASAALLPAGTGLIGLALNAPGTKRRTPPLELPK